MLSDARERAQAIIDESTERARELIRQERAAHAAPVGGIDPSAFDDLRRGLRGLVTEVRDIQQRLARIEQLIRDQDARAAGHATTGSPAAQQRPSASIVASAPEPGIGDVSYPEPRAIEAEPLPAWQTSEPVFDEPEYDEADDEPRPEEPSEESRYDPSSDFRQSDTYAEPEFETSPAAAAESETPEPFEVPEAPPAPAPAPPRSSFSVVPPQRREWDVAGQDESPRAPAWETVTPDAPPAYEPPSAPPRTYGNAEPAAERAPGPATWDDEAYDEPSEVDAESSRVSSSHSPLVTFLPSDGAITLRVAPVAGFQGLMRIQDALTRLPAVRHASVEAYSQGEARLRIELSDTSDSDEIAEGLSRALRGPARVEDASEVNRELLIGLR